MLICSTTAETDQIFITELTAADCIVSLLALSMKTWIVIDVSYDRPRPDSMEAPNVEYPFRKLMTVILRG